MKGVEGGGGGGGVPATYEVLTMSPLGIFLFLHINPKRIFKIIFCLRF